jgi:glutathione S-transferase
MLDHKRIQYERHDLVPGAHIVVLKALRFPGITVPAIRLDGRRVQGTRGIARALDEVQPAPPLFPSDPERRRRVEQAEALGEGELQHAARRLFYCAGRRDPSGFTSVVLGMESGLGAVKRIVVRRAARAILFGATQGHGASDEVCRDAVRSLPALLDRIDGWIAEGVLDGDALNAADFHAGVNVRLLMLFDQLHPLVEGRAAAGLALRVAPEYPGRIRSVLPPDWFR